MWVKVRVRVRVKVRVRVTLGSPLAKGCGSNKYCISPSLGSGMGDSVRVVDQG